MRRRSTLPLPWTWTLAVATLLGAFSTLMAAQITVVSKGASPPWGTLAAPGRCSR